MLLQPILVRTKCDLLAGEFEGEEKKERIRQTFLGDQGQVRAPPAVGLGENVELFFTSSRDTEMLKQFRQSIHKSFGLEFTGMQECHERMEIPTNQPYYAGDDDNGSAGPPPKRQRTDGTDKNRFGQV
jgi:hypothetical protein